MNKKITELKLNCTLKYMIFKTKTEFTQIHPHNIILVNIIK